MKKVLSFFTLSLILLFSVVGCAAPKSNPTPSPSSKNNNESVISNNNQSISNSSEQNSSIPNSSQNATISKDDAKRIALENAAVSESDIFDYEIELDYERGILTYEISFETKDFEYDYDINANDGTIINSEKEPNDIY